MNTDARILIGHAVQPVLEGLERRQLMAAHNSVELAGSTLNITGTDQNDEIVVYRSSDNSTLWASINGVETTHYDQSSIFAIYIDAKEGDNRIDVDERTTENVSVRTGSGNDTILTGQGNDNVQSGAGRDYIRTRSGNDVVNAGSGHDTVYGNGGNDYLIGDTGNDKLNGGRGIDKAVGANGSDRIFGTKRSTLYTGNGNDSLTHLDSQTGEVIPGKTPRIAKISLINVKTGNVISGFGDLRGNVTLDLNKLPEKIALVVNGGNGTGSIKFIQDGESTSTDSVFPYAMAGESNGNYNAWTTSLGEHKIELIPYALDSARGEKGETVTLNVTVKRPTGPTPDVPTNNPSTPTATRLPTARISAETLTVKAGQSFHAHATKSSVPGEDLEDAVFSWDFGDPNGEHNRLEGFNSAHVYDKAGHYTVKLTVTNSEGRSHTTTVAVNVEAAQYNNIFVSPSGNDANDGQTSGRTVKTIDRAMELLDDNTRIIFQRGGTYNISDVAVIDKSNVVIGAYGQGSAPVIRYNGGLDRGVIFSIPSSASNVVVQDLTFTSIHNTADRTGMPTAIQVWASNVTVRNNTFEHLGFAINANGQPERLLVMDNDAPLDVGITDYFIWTEGQDIVIVGNYVANSTREHIVRVCNVDRLAVVDNDLSNINRQDEGDQYDIAKGVITNQKGQYSYIEGNTLHGPSGIGPLGFGDGLGDKQARFKHAVFANNFVYDDTFYIRHGAQNVTVRNNVLDGNGRAAIYIDAYQDDYQRGVIDVVIDRNTAYNDEITGNFVYVGRNIDGLTITSNLYIAPNLIPGQYNTAPVFVSDNDLNGIRKITNNLWPVGNGIPWVQGGVNFVGTEMTPENWFTGSEWNALDGVGEDFFQDVTTSARDIHQFTLGTKKFGSALVGNFMR